MGGQRDGVHVARRADGVLCALRLDVRALTEHRPDRAGLGASLYGTENILGVSGVNDAAARAGRPGNLGDPHGGVRVPGRRNVDGAGRDAERGRVAARIEVLHGSGVLKDVPLPPGRLVDAVNYRLTERDVLAVVDLLPRRLPRLSVDESTKLASALRLRCIARHISRGEAPASVVAGPNDRREHLVAAHLSLIRAAARGGV